ncbi:hypothetical protein DFH94DRAFT_639669, partial [Russula ochroleuca]
QKFNRARSISPAQAGSSRGRYRSYSPPTRGGSPPRRQAESHTRDHGGRARKDRREFFRPSADSRGEVCAACLGRHEHTFAKCDGHRLWDGSSGAARKHGLGKLVGTDGSPLCYDWQLPRGCQSTSHPEKHRCSGCGRSSHGAQSCPRAEKA